MTVLRVALAQLNPTVGDLDGNVAKLIARLRPGRGGRLRHRRLPRAGDHRLPAGGPRAEAGLRRRQPRSPSASSPPAPAAAPPSSASSTRTATSTTPPRSAPTARSSAPIASGCCRTTPCSTRPATSRPATRPIRSSCTSIGGVKVGISICEDIWSPDGPLAEQAAGGAELSININGSPYHRGKAADRERMLATRAADAHCALVYVNQVGGQDELVFDGGSMVFDAEGNLIARGPQFVEDAADRRRAGRRPSTASGCSTRAAGARTSRCRWCTCPRRPSRHDAAARHRSSSTLSPRGRAVRGAGARHPRLRAQERLHRRGDRSVGWHRLDARRRASRSTRSAPTTCTACRCRRATPATTRSRRRRLLAANLGIDYRTIADRAGVRGLPRHARRRVVRGPAARPDRGEHAEPLPRSDVDGAVEQVRLDGADHRQQERDGRRLLHPLRRLRRRVRGDQGRAQDRGLRPVPVRTTSGPGASSSPRPSSPSRRRPSCAPTSATTRACRRTRCSTRS